MHVHYLEGWDEILVRGDCIIVTWNVHVLMKRGRLSWLLHKKEGLPEYQL